VHHGSCSQEAPGIRDEGGYRRCFHIIDVGYPGDPAARRSVELSSRWRLSFRVPRISPEEIRSGNRSPDRPTFSPQTRFFISFSRRKKRLTRGNITCCKYNYQSLGSSLLFIVSMLNRKLLNIVCTILLRCCKICYEYLHVATCEIRVRGTSDVYSDLARACATLSLLS